MIALDHAGFAVKVERLRWPPLRGRPVVIATPGVPRAPVVATSEEAETAGIFAGQTLGTALHLCPEAEVVPPDPDTYRAIAAEIAAILAWFTPAVEPAEAGRFFLDVTGWVRPERGLGPVVDLGLRARRRIAERVGLDATVGVATNKLVSGIAAEEAAPRDLLRDVEPGNEALFLAPLPVPRLPGVGERTEGRLLADLNVRWVGQLAAIPVPTLARIFGLAARELRERALGIDLAPVRTGAAEPDIAESETLAGDSNDDAILDAALARLVADVGWRLRSAGLGARRLALSVVYIDDVNAHASVTLRHPVAADARLLVPARGLFARVRTRRVRVRTLSLACRELVRAAAQIDLFADQPSEATRLAEVMDSVRRRFGAGALRYGRSLWAPST